VNRTWGFAARGFAVRGFGIAACLAVARKREGGALKDATNSSIHCLTPLPACPAHGCLKMINE
jgi:hypothetical protein